MVVVLRIPVHSTILIRHQKSRIYEYRIEIAVQLFSSLVHTSITDAWSVSSNASKMGSSGPLIVEQNEVTQNPDTNMNSLRCRVYDSGGDRNRRVCTSIGVLYHRELRL